MLTEERFARIISAVDSNGSVTVTELMKLLGASESTIRRDLDELDSEGRITRVRGGAISKTGGLMTRDDEVSKRKGQKQKEKATKRPGSVWSWKMKPIIRRPARLWPAGTITAR